MVCSLCPSEMFGKFSGVLNIRCCNHRVLVVVTLDLGIPVSDQYTTGSITPITVVGLTSSDYCLCFLGAISLLYPDPRYSLFSLRYVVIIMNISTVLGLVNCSSKKLYLK